MTLEETREEYALELKTAQASLRSRESELEETTARLTAVQAAFKAHRAKEAEAKDATEKRAAAMRTEVEKLAGELSVALEKGRVLETERDALETRRRPCVSGNKLTRKQSRG